MQPIRGRILVARIIVIASCVVALAPYLALVKLGTILLSAHIDHEALVHTANLLVAAFCTQALLYVLALVITHFADLKTAQCLAGSHHRAPVPGTAGMVQFVVHRAGA